MSLPDAFFPHSAAEVYTPSGVGNSMQLGKWFLPWGPQPPGGWPVVPFSLDGGWLLGEIPATFTKQGTGGTIGNGLQNSALPWLLLASGTAAVFAYTTTKLGALDSAGAVIPGKGTFKSPSVAEFGTQDFCEKDACLVAQYIEHRAAYYGCAPRKRIGVGISQAASMHLFSQFSRNRANNIGFWPQYSTRIEASIAMGTQFLFRACDPSNPNYPTHFPQSADVAPYNTVAATLGASNPTWLDDASVLKYGFENDVANSSWSLPNMTEVNSNNRVLIVTDSKPEYAGMPANNPAFRTTADTAWNNCAGYTAYTGAVGSNNGVYTVNGYHAGHAHYLFKEACQRIGMPFGAKGGLSRLVTTQAAAKQSTWDLADLSNDQVAQTLIDFGPEAEGTQIAFEWIRAVIRELAA